MTVLRESPWYEEILQQGVQQGRRESLVRLLQLRFGEIPAEVQASLQELTLERLQDLMATALAVNSLEKFSQPKPG